MSEQVYKLAKKNYPEIWDDECLRNLVEHEPQRLTPEEYERVTSKPYESK